MKNLGKKIIGVLLVLILLSGCNISLALTSSERANLETEVKNKQEEIENNKNKVTSNKKEIEEVENEKKEITEQKNETVKQVAELDTQINDYESQISTLDGQISEANSKIQDTTAKLNQAQKDYENQQKMLEERVVALYEAGETSYLDVLLSSESVTDFISSYYVISEIAQCDVDLLNEIDKKKNEIESVKKELEENKSKLTSARTNKQLVASKLEASRTEKQNKVNQLSEEEKNLQAKIDEIAQANKTINSLIASASKELESKLDELKKQEPPSSGGSSSSSGGATSGTSSSGFIHPVPAAYAKITTTWYYSSGAIHGAVDYGPAGINGQPVYAVADGVVWLTQALTTSYGNYIVIKHTNGLFTLYAHGQAGSICVSKGQIVRQGQQIMRVGSTGNSSGPHLHFEVRTSPGEYNNRKNPLNYLP